MSKNNDFEFYERDGKRYDRITACLDYFASPELVNWKLRVGKREAGRISREALKIGENVDLCIRVFLDGDGDNLPKLKTQEAKNCWEAFQSWLSVYAPDVDHRKLCTIGTVFSDELCVAGTPDLEWNVHTVIDIKCSNAIRPQYWLQTEFYGRQMPCCKNKAILRLDKNLGIFEFKMMSLSDEHWAATVGAIKLYRVLAVKDGEQKEESNECNTISNATVGASNAT